LGTVSLFLRKTLSEEEIMETFKKRQKAWARKEKQQKKLARKMERREEKAKSGGTVGENKPKPAESTDRPGATIL
jgi:hypothetical protein